MDWILDHLRLIIGAAGAIAWWLNKRKQERATGQLAPRKEATSGDPDLAERTRRIREEIQRKIEQRARSYKEPAPPAPPLVREAAASRIDPPLISKTHAARFDAQKNAEILEQQAALAEKLRQATELKAAAARRVQFENQTSGEEPARAAARSALAEDLRNPAVLRRAFVLREIIGPPVALR